MDIGMAAGTDGEETLEEGYGKVSELAAQEVYKGTRPKGGWSGGVPVLERTEVLQQRQRVRKERIVVERDSGPRPEARKEEQGTSLNAVEEGKWVMSVEVREDELHARRLLEESENEQRQEVTSKKSKLNTKRSASESLLSVENKSCATPMKVIGVKDNWLNIRLQWTQELRGMSCRQRCSRE